MPSAPTNRYEFTDASVARPWLTKVWFERLFPLLPRWMAANVVTLLSTGLLLVVLAASLVVDRLGGTWVGLLQLVCIQLYVAGDHLDGMQAKATGTTSPLGDFLDHHCDYWAGCILVFGWCAMLGAMQTWLLPIMTLLMVSGFIITYTERALFRRLHFTSWGTLEAIVLATLFYGSWAWPAARGWWSAPLWDGGWPRHAVVTGVGCLMAAGVSVTIVRRMRGLPWVVVVQLASLVALAAWAQGTAAPPIWGWALVALCGAEMVARLMHAHTTGGERTGPTWGAVAGAVTVWVLPHDLSWMAAVVCGAAVAVTYVLTLKRIIGGWSRHWVWANTAGAAALLVVAALAVAPTRVGAQSSVYVPLLDGAYEDLDALAAAGLVRKVMLGERPYSREAFVRFVAEAQQREGVHSVTPRVQEALARLAARFGDAGKRSVHRTPLTLTFSLADAPARAMRPGDAERGIDADLVLLRQRNQGRVMPDGAALAAETGVAFERSRLAAEVVGRVHVGSKEDGGGDVQLMSAVARSVWGAVALDLGRTPLQAGFGRHGGSMFTDNARGWDQIRVRADRPIRLPGPFRALGQWQALISLGTMGNNRDNPGSVLFASRLSSRPIDALELGFSYQNLQGGRGAPSPASWRDRINDLFFFFLRDTYVDEQVSDKVLGADVRLSSRALQSAIYVNFATTDDRGFFHQPAGGYWEDAIWVAGLERRGLGRDGRLDLALEARHAGPNPHAHGQFTSGMVLDRRVLGDAMGPNSEGVSLHADWRAAEHRTRVSLAVERYRRDLFTARPSYDAPFRWDWFRLTDEPDEMRQRLTVERRQEVGWRGLETVVLVGYERALRFDFGERTRHAGIVQLQLLAPGGR